jgi:chromate transporter
MPRIAGSEFFRICLRIGNLTFGGGDPTIAVLHRELVERRSSLTPDEYAVAFTMARLTPGTNMLAFAAAAGWTLLGLAGACIAVVAMSAPSAVLVVWITKAYESWKTNTLAMAAIRGVIAAAVGMMLAAAWALIRPKLRRASRLQPLVLFVAAILLMVLTSLGPVTVLGLSAIAGWFWGRGGTRT